MDMKAIHQWIDDHKDEMISTIRELVAVKSVEGKPEEGAPFGAGPRKALDKFIEISDRMGFATGVFENQVGWAIEGKEDDEFVGILAHVDVVPEGEGWSCDPYEGKIENGYLYGRGVADDKGPAVCSLYALKALRESGVNLDKAVRVLVGTNEETGSKAVEHYVKSGMPLPCCGFTPDADFPLINGEKGMVTLKLSAPFTPGGDIKVTEFTAGMAANAVPAKAECVIEVSDDKIKRVQRALQDWRTGLNLELTHEQEGNTFKLHMKGLSYHGMAPQNGASAAAEMVALLRLLDVGGEQGEFFSKIDDAVGHQGFGQSLGLLRYDDITGFASLCMGLMNKEENKIVFTWNYRYPVTIDVEQINSDVVAAAKKCGFTIETESYANPLYVPEDDPLVVKLMKAYKEQTGRDDRPFAIGGGTYAKAMKNMVAFGLCFPEEKQYIHEVDERWEIDKIILSTKILTAAIVELAGVK